MGHAHGAKLGLLLLGVLAIIPSHSHGGDLNRHHKRKLSEYVHHFEPLDYDASDIHHQHHRHKRSLRQDDHKVRIQFSSHGRDFELELQRDHSVFHNKIVVERGDNIAHDVDLSHIYEGKLADEPGSHCFGAIRNGIFDGQIHAKDGVYYVERANRYFKNDLIPQDEIDNRTSSEFHSVIYHEKNLVDPFHHSKKVNLGFDRPGCGISDSVQSWMDQIQHGGENSAHNTTDVNTDNDQEVLIHFSNEAEQVGPAYKYSVEGNTRRKRSLDNPNKNRKSCSLYIQTDPLFWLHIKEQEKEDAKIEEEILSLIAQHVKAVNRIYSDTSFDGKYKHNGYQFEVQRIKIHNDEKCKGLANRLANSNSQPSFYSSLELSTLDEEHPFCTPNVDVSNFLNLHSKSDHQEFCLAYVFTYRDFTGGTLGLAWVASASGASGGICETYKRYTENINGIAKTAKRSLNTGIITFVNYNSPVPPKVSQLTLAHEIGHNFGSPHDYPSECRPGGKAGNFIMFASATSGDRDNNNKFSDCSKQNISAVLDAITDGRKTNCFEESNGAFCGNKIVEEGEECDCGFDDQECVEECCYPRKSSQLSPEENNKLRCKRRPNAECSPSEGPCCDKETCRYTSAFSLPKVQCKNEDDCTEASFCDGKQAQCPEPDHKPDNITECNQGTQVCQQGECKDSICVKYGLTSCYLSSEVVINKRQLCELACQRPGNNNTCMSTKELVAAGSIPGLREGLSLRPGSPCDNYQGYCDVFLKCRKVDAEGPLVRLKNLLFNQETLINIVQWVTDWWWAVLLMGIAFVIFMAVFIKCFAIHTPSSNPRLPKNLHFTETLRRPVRSLQQRNYRQANNGSSGAPPPYPGRGGPGHGYGEGRGHYNRASSHPAEFNRQSSSTAKDDGGRGGGRGRSGDRNRSSAAAAGNNRHSRMEMQPIR